MDWPQLVLTGGVSLALLVFIAIFIERRVWPFVTEQLKASQEERRQERKGWDEERRTFLTTLQQINANQSASTQAIQQIAQSIQRIEVEAKRTRERGTRQ